MLSLSDGILEHLDASIAIEFPALPIQIKISE